MTAPPPTPTDEPQVRTPLEQVRQQAVELLGELGRTPRTLRVRVGDTAVEIEWPEPAAAVAPTAVLAGTASAALGLESPAPAALSQAENPTSDGGRTAGTPAADDARYVTAPTVGTFYTAPAPGSPPFVQVGDVVSAGQQIGIIEAMKLMIPIEADQAGRVTAVLRVDGEAVEYGERLLALADGEA